MSENPVKVFSKNFVLKGTIIHMLKAIDFGINRTFEQVPNNADDLEKSREIFETLSILHTMRKQINEFQWQTPEHKGK